MGRRLGLAFAVVVAVLVPGAQAATPASGTVSPESTTTAWVGGPFLTSNPVACVPLDPACDRFALTIVPPAEGAYTVEIAISTG